MQTCLFRQSLRISSLEIENNVFRCGEKLFFL